MPTGQQYASNVPQTNIPAGVSAAATLWTVASSTGWPSPPFTAVLDIGTAVQEPVDVGAVAGANWSSITRAIDSTTAFVHGPACTVTFGVTGRDFRESRSHIDASTNVHGLTGGAAVVGDITAQTLTNKTINSPVIVTPAITQATFSAGSAAIPAVINGAPAQSVDMFQVVPNASPNAALKVDSQGRVVVIGPGGTNVPFTVFGLANQTADLIDVDDSVGNKVFKVTANGATGAGATVITPTDTGNAALAINAPNATTADVWNAQINAVKKWSVSSAGNLVAGSGVQADLSAATAAQPFLGPAWTSYTPTWTAVTTNPVIGNGNLDGHYIQYGKTVHFRISMTAGTTTTFGSGAWGFALPVAAKTGAFTNESMGSVAGLANHTGVSVITVVGNIVSAATGLQQNGVNDFLMTPSNTGNGLNSTVPFTWASGDHLWLAGTYESA